MPHAQTTYRRIPHAALYAAQLLAEATQREANTRTGRLMCHIIAAGVHDILTDHDPDPAAPCDAVLAELICDPSGFVQLSGAYWTAAGERGELDPPALFELNEWAGYLDEANEHVWRPLCELISDQDGHAVYRFDLVKAARGPLDVLELPADLARIKAAWDRLSTALPRPWHTRETLHNADGGAYASDDEAEYVSVEVVAANGMRVAELGAAMGPGDVEDQHDRRSVLAGVRADADLIATAPQDLAYLLSQLAQAEDQLARTQH
ncbi:hypothetical protein [Streptomyces sp. IBSNAI001]|uniref:hypothetical protein n=1 Tax=Streptomyces sp. IBSNAI001 TaxID=3457499 RepID=UPI003FD38C97